MSNWICKPLAIAALFGGCTLPPAALAGWFGPSNYDECVLDKIKDAANTAAVIAVYRSCEKLFPPKIVSLPVAAQNKVFVSSALFAAGVVELIIRNSNPDWTINSLDVVFMEIPGKPGTVRVFTGKDKPAEGAKGTGYAVTDTIPGSTDPRVRFELDGSKAYGVDLMRQRIKGHR